MLKALHRLLREKELTFEGYETTLEELKDFCGFRPGESLYYGPQDDETAEAEEAESRKSSRTPTPQASGRPFTASRVGGGSVASSTTTQPQKGKDLIHRLLSKGLLPLAALDVIRGWLLLEMAVSTEDDRRLIRAATQGRLGYHDIRAALLSMFEERGARPNVPYVGKGGKPGNRTHYQEEYNFQGNEYDDTQGESTFHVSDAQSSWDESAWQDEWQDQSAWWSSDMGNTGQAWSEHEEQYEQYEAQQGDEAYAWQCAQEEFQEAERSHAELQAMVAESERSLIEARRAVAAAAKDRGWNQGPLQRQSRPTSTYMNKGKPKGSFHGKANYVDYGNKGKFTGPPRGGKGFGNFKGKGKNLNAAMDGSFHIMTIDQETAFSAQESEGLQPTESVVDTGATATAGGRWAVQQLCQAVLQNRPGAVADVYMGHADRPWFRYGNGNWGRALFRLTITYGDMVVTLYSLPSPGVPVLTGMRELDQWNALLGCRSGKSLINGSPTTLRQTKKKHLVIDYLKDVFPENPKVTKHISMISNDGNRPARQCIRVHGEQETTPPGAQCEQYFAEVLEFWTVFGVGEQFTCHENTTAPAMYASTTSCFSSPSSHVPSEQIDSFAEFLDVSQRELQFLLSAQEQADIRKQAIQKGALHEVHHVRRMEEGVESSRPGDGASRSSEVAEGSSFVKRVRFEQESDHTEEEEDSVRLHSRGRPRCKRSSQPEGDVALLQSPHSVPGLQQPVRSMDRMSHLRSQAQLCPSSRRTRSVIPCGSSPECDGSSSSSTRRRLGTQRPGEPQGESNDQDCGQREGGHQGQENTKRESRECGEQGWLQEEGRSIEYGVHPKEEAGDDNCGGFGGGAIHNGGPAATGGVREVNGRKESSQSASTRMHHDEGWDTSMRLLEAAERKRLTEASKEFDLGAMMSSLQDCGQPHLVWEICCRPTSNLTRACQQQGIQAIRKTLETGYDILQGSTKDQLSKELKKEKPDRSWWSLKCTEWTSIQNINMRTELQRETLRKRRLRARRGVRNALSLIEEALDDNENHKFYWEWPKHAFAGWKMAEMRAFEEKMQKRGIRLYWTEIHGCHFGMKAPSGEFVQKAWWIMSNDPDFDYRCSFQCPRDHEHRRGGIIGMGTMAVMETGYYPIEMCKAIAKVWKSQWEQKKRRDAERHVRESFQMMDMHPETFFPAEVAEAPEDGGALEEVSKEKKDRALALLHRLHKAAGHPTNAALARLCKERNSPGWLVQMAKDLKCQACIDVQRGEQKIVPYSLGAKPSPWQLIAADTYELVFPARRRKVRFLLMACVTMRFVSVAQLWEGPLGDAGIDSGRKLSDAFVEGWLLHRPKPQWILVDPQTSLAQGDFPKFCHNAGIGVSVTPGEAHWQNGLIESTIRVIKNTMRKIRGEQPLLEPITCAQLAVHAHNNLSRVKGFSPIQWAYGTDFKQDSMTMEPEEYNAGAQRFPWKFWEVQRNREMAERLWKETQAQEALTRLRNAAPREPREFQVGEWVCIWRTAIWRSRKGSQNPEPRFVGPGRVALREPAVESENRGSVYWVLLGTQIWRCAPEQMRRASPMEITMEEITNNQRFSVPVSELLKQSSKVVDVTREGGFPQEQEHLPDQPFAGPMPAIPDEHGRSQPVEDWQEDMQDMDDRWSRRRKTREATVPEERQETAKERAMRWQQLISLNENRRREGLPPVMELPPLMPHDREEMQQTQYYNLEENDAPMTMETYQAIVAKIEELEEELKFQKERELLLQQIEEEMQGEILFKEMLSMACEKGDEVCEIVLEVEDWQSFCNNGTLYTKQAMSHAKEVSFKNLKPHHKKLMEEAMSREVNEVVRSQALRALKEKITEEVLQERCIPMRWILTWKPLDEWQDPNAETQPGVIREDGYAKAKARIVLIGYKHPDLARRNPRTGQPLLQTSSPTLSRLGRNLLLQACALDGHTLECGDAKSAFLQADEGVGTDNLYTRGVAEIRHALGVGPKEALKVVGAIYGLTNAPRIFWRDVDSKLQKIGFVPHAIDKCVWIFKSRAGKVIGRIGSHVDDFLLMGDHKDPEWQSVRSKVFDMYSWSPWKRGQFTFAGIQLQQLQDHSIMLSQEQFCNQLQPVKIENERLRPKDDTLTAKELSQARGLIMQAQWRAIQTAPQYCCRIGLASSALTKPTLENLREANAIVKELKKSSKDNMILHSFHGENRSWRNMVFLHFSDAAQRNRPDGSDTGGYVTAISTSRILEGKEARTSILDFRSFKLERPVKGSNGAEGQAVFETEDKGWKCRVFWSLLYGETLNRTNADELAAMNESLLIMDSRGCYDALNSDSPLLGMNNAKTGVEMLSVKRGVRDGSNCYLTWVPSDMNIADAMTKVSPDAFKVYALWQQRKTWIVRFDEEFVSARKQQKLRRAKMEETKSKESCLELWPEEELEYHDGSNSWPHRK